MIFRIFLHLGRTLIGPSRLCCERAPHVTSLAVGFSALSRLPRTQSWWLIIPRTSNSEQSFTLNVYRKIEKKVSRLRCLYWGWHSWCFKIAESRSCLSVFYIYSCLQEILEQEHVWWQWHCSQGAKEWPLDNIRAIYSFDHIMNLRFPWYWLYWAEGVRHWGPHYPQCCEMYAPLFSLYHHLCSGMVLSRVLWVGPVSSVNMSSWQPSEVKEMDHEKGRTRHY